MHRGKFGLLTLLQSGAGSFQTFPSTMVPLLSGTWCQPRRPDPLEWGANSVAQHVFMLIHAAVLRVTACPLGKASEQSLVSLTGVCRAHSYQHKTGLGKGAWTLTTGSKRDGLKNGGRNKSHHIRQTDISSFEICLYSTDRTRGGGGGESTIHLFLCHIYINTLW